MKPVDQDLFGDGTDGSPAGNCYAACLASLLEIPLSGLPELVGAAEPGATQERLVELWANSVQATNQLLGRYGLAVVDLDWNEDAVAEWAWYMVPDDAYVIARGPAERGFPHCCVYRGRSLVHDPHPSRAGLLRVNGLTWLAVRDPAIVIGQRTEQQLAQSVATRL